MKRDDQDFLTLIVPKDVKQRMNVLAALQPEGRVSINNYFMSKFWGIVETQVNQEYLQLGRDLPKQIQAEAPTMPKKPRRSPPKSR